MEADAAGFAAALRTENRTLKRVLTDPRIFSGIGNSYSDEILWAARLSPATRTAQLTDEEVERLRLAVHEQLNKWTNLLRQQVGEGWPEKVTAFRPEMAVHGKFNHPCPRCGSLVQRIAYADNETNYCATCQTNGRLLADRSLASAQGRLAPHPRRARGAAPGLTTEDLQSGTRAGIRSGPGQGGGFSSSRSASSNPPSRWPRAKSGACGSRSSSRWPRAKSGLPFSVGSPPAPGRSPAEPRHLRGGLPATGEVGTFLLLDQ